MSRLDVYLRSIEKFGASGAVLISNQAITLRFPTGDRRATQVTPHDVLVGMVREVASPPALDQIDRHQPARFDYQSGAMRYAIDVAPRNGVWQVTIEPTTARPVASASRPTAAANRPAAQAPAIPDAARTDDLLIERGQYDEPSASAAPAASASTWLDQLTRAARAAHATDLYLSSGTAPLQRAGTEVTAVGDPLDGDQLSREVGVVAPAGARAAWADGGTAMFAYGDGAGRVRATLGRDRRGPTATFRLLPDDAQIERMDLGNLREISDWLGRSGLIVIAGPSGIGKTVTLAALLRSIGTARRRVVSIEEPIEIEHANPWVSQREIGTHVESMAAGVAAAMRENADAIAIGSTENPDAAEALFEAAGGGHLVLTTIAAPTGHLGIERLVHAVAPERRELARALLSACLLGTICPVRSRGGGRTFEVTRPGERRA